MYTMNSSESIHGGVIFCYKTYEKKSLLILPTFGTGIETFSTSLSERDDKTNETENKSVATINLSFGISAIKQVLRKNHIGFELNYHYCPYNLDNNLNTQFNNSAISAELFLRF